MAVGNARKGSMTTRSERQLVLEFFQKRGITRKTKRQISSLFNQGIPEPVYGSLSEYARLCYDDESLTEYGILDPADFEGGTEEIIDILKSYEHYNTTNYDCSGQYCTMYQHIHVNPTGLISYVHHMVLDV